MLNRAMYNPLDGYRKLYALSIIMNFDERYDCVNLLNFAYAYIDEFR